MSRNPFVYRRFRQAMIVAVFGLIALCGAPTLFDQPIEANVDPLPPSPVALELGSEKMHPPNYIQDQSSATPFLKPADGVQKTNPGSLDTSFSTSLVGFPGVFGVAIQNDGKIVIGGSFNQVNGITQNRIARLNQDGTLDQSFQTGSGANAYINDVELLPDGKIMICGGFTTINSTNRQSIARLNEDGSIDESFNPGVGPNDDVFSLAAQPDQKVVMYGRFTSVNGVARNGLARLNADGSLDMTFNAGTGANNIVFALALKIDGKVLIGGTFTSVNGVAQSSLVQLNPDGSVDTSFNARMNGGVFTIAPQSNGSILIGGGFSSAGGGTRGRIARLNADGSLDTTFNPGTGANSSVFDLALQADGKTLIYGPFTSFNGVPQSRFARLNANGSLDTAFDSGTSIGTVGDISDIGVLSSGKIVIGGTFFSYKGEEHIGVGLINSDGNADPQFTSRVEVNSQVFAVGTQPDGKIIIGGSFITVNNQVSSFLARLNQDGSTDRLFNLGAGPNAEVYSIFVKESGEILIGGRYTVISGFSRSYFSQLNPDGTLDANFNTSTRPNNSVFSIVSQSNGKVIIGGPFTMINGVEFGGIARLNSNGNLDLGFNPGAGFNGTVETVVLQPDGKVVAGGSFTAFNGVERKGIARLNPDGSLDTSFNPPQLLGRVFRLAAQSDGKIVAGGLFTLEGRANILRLNADGSLDQTFDPGPGTNGSITEITIQPDEKILISGRFTSINGVNRIQIARLTRTGQVDVGFNPGDGPNNVTRAMSLQANGSIVIGGDFTAVDGVKRTGIARLTGGDSAIPQVSVSTPKAGDTFTNGTRVDITWATTSTTPLESHTLTLSTDGGTTFGTTLATGLPGTAQSFSWLIPSSLTTELGQVQVTARDTNAGLGSGVSGVFKIQRGAQPPQVTITNPKAGDTLSSGTMVSITWTTSSTTSLASHSISLSTDGGTSFGTVISSNLPGSAQSFSWTIPSSLETTSAQIRVTAQDTSGVSGVGTSGQFAIGPTDMTPPAVTNVTLSKKKVVRRTDPTLTITWLASDDQGVTAQNLVYASDGTQFSVEVVSGLAGSATQFTWSVPVDLAKTKTGKIKVIATDRAGNVGEAISPVVKIK